MVTAGRGCRNPSGTKWLRFLVDLFSVLMRGKTIQEQPFHLIATAKHAKSAKMMTGSLLVSFWLDPKIDRKRFVNQLLSQFCGSTRRRNKQIDAVDAQNLWPRTDSVIPDHLVILCAQGYTLWKMFGLLKNYAFTLMPGRAAVIQGNRRSLAFICGLLSADPQT